MTQVPPGSGAAPRRSWALALIGGVIAAALATVVWLQVHQFQLLNLTTQYQDDYLQVSLGQLEAEYLRLNSQWREAMAHPSSDRAALQLRHDVFVSRVALLDTDRARRIFGDTSDLAAILQEMHRFINAADQVLAARTPQGGDGAALEALWPALQALGPRIHALGLDGSHGLAAQSTKRNEALRETNRNTIALTVLLALAAFGLTVLALSQFRRLEQRRRDLEEVTHELRDAQRVAEAASLAKSTFLANMSHEIRTPLQGVLGMLALLADSPLDAHQQQRLSTARDSADHLLAILNDILDLAKLEAGKLATATEPVELRRLTGDVEALMRSQALAKGLSMTVDVADDVPAWLELDPTRVRQILLNLCSNAIKFTQRGRVGLRARVEHGQLRLSVHDTGIGIDATTLEQLFQRFGRGDESRARRHGGTGLGLEISRQLARLMGGDIEVTSTPGAGSTFVLTLAALPAAPPQAAPADALLAQAAPRTDPLRVLVVDDNAVNREYTGAVLERLGHQVAQAADGGEAVQRIQAQPFDLVLMDLHMPEVDGLAATRMIRALRGAAARVPIVALTADAFAETRAACEAAGMDGFAAKPVSPAVLAQLLAQYAVRAAEAAALVDERVLHGILRVLPSDKAASLAHKFADETRASMLALHAAMSAGDRSVLRQRAHSLKGMSASLGLTAMAAAAARLQGAAESADAAAPGPALQALDELVAPSQQALQAQLDSHVSA